ncbi:MAG: molybdate ABC transporter substrate-binding protein [Acidobacteriia bacterium]|nr:molybdate ABC transporter substrate-binding protein [Terriglobia bacterium]
MLSLTCLLLAATVFSAAQPETLSIAAASDLRFAMQELAARFEQQTGNKVNVTYGSSGNFFAQIQSGAPFDLFFSADSDYPRQLVAAGLAESGTFYEYAVGRLVLWVPADSPVDVVHRGWDALLDPAIRKIAIANPQHAPYGRAAVAALKSVGIYERVESKLVYGENISQAAQFVQSGNAQVALLAYSLAVSPTLQSAGKYWEVPAAAHPPLLQAAVVLRSSPRKALAQSFLQFLKSPEGQSILRRNGFTSPAAAAAPPPGKP